MNELLTNIDKLHTTELGVMRISRNLSLQNVNVVEWCKSKVLDTNAQIHRQGKNWYVMAVPKAVIQRSVQKPSVTL